MSPPDVKTISDASLESDGSASNGRATLAFWAGALATNRRRA
jgi:hypothetical protein